MPVVQYVEISSKMILTEKWKGTTRYYAVLYFLIAQYCTSSMYVHPVMCYVQSYCIRTGKKARALYGFDVMYGSSTYTGLLTIASK